MQEKKFYINYPQEKIAEGVNVYRCQLCKVESLVINGLIENHKLDCPYRIQNQS
jgi:hypothetical protein